MNGKSVLDYIKNLCDTLDLRAKTARIAGTALMVAVPVTAGFTVACYGVPGDLLYPYPDSQPEICTNGIDDDYDGLTDCDDSDCARLEVCLGCDDGLDNDGDGRADCSDPSCQNVAPCSDEICTDLIDNDGDGLIGCDDPDCEGLELCLNATDEWDNLVNSCADGVDNDGNGAIDCDDTSCASSELCQGGDAACRDGIDNDQDGHFDCDDADCRFTPSCS
jgi:hypothetical protein